MRFDPIIIKAWQVQIHSHKAPVSVMALFSTPQGYTITDILCQDDDVILCRGVRVASDQPVILRVSPVEPSSPGILAGLRRDFEIARRLDGAVTLPPLDLVTSGPCPALILEDFGGEPLRRQLDRPMALDLFFRTAAALTAAVSNLHRQDVIHGNLTPQTILVHPGTGEIRLIGFALALDTPQTPPPPGRPEGVLAYMAPERTGRTNRAVDHRADLYTLGVIFYEMLTGMMPFYGADALEWVHCHLARVASPPKAIMPTIPEMLSQLVLKLLAKPVEERYQSGRGLAIDLERCHDRWQRGRDDLFVLGARDVSERFQLPQRPYGRDSQIAQLQTAFNRVAATGRAELILISGSSGIGKSTLVNELRPLILEAHGLLLTGKFQPRRQAMSPYAVLAHDLQALIQDILGENEEKIAFWRQRLSNSIANYGQLLIDIIPQIRYIIGESPQLPELSVAEAQSRLSITFRRFIESFALKKTAPTAGRPAYDPLVLFFDDLHWADAASLSPLQDLLTSPDPHPILLIGAYRDTEVASDHPLIPSSLDGDSSRLPSDAGRAHPRPPKVTRGLRVHEDAGPPSRPDTGDVSVSGLAGIMALRTTAQACPTTVTEIQLVPLTASDVTAFVADTVHRSPEFVAPLARLIRTKTGGNPFFMAQLLTELNQKRLIRFSGGWSWNLTQIEAEGLTAKDIAELLTARIRRLPPDTRTLLIHAACLGHTTDLATLVIVHGRGPEQTAVDLAPAVDAGLLTHTNHEIRFVHDRVDEVAYAQVPEPQRATLHLTLGRRLLAHNATAPGSLSPFVVVDQFNRCLEQVSDPQERRRLAEFNLEAGRKAKNAGGYQAALPYLAAGLRLMTPTTSTDLDEAPLLDELTWALHFDHAQCDYLRGALEDASAQLEALLSRTPAPMDRARIHRVRIALFTTSGDIHRAIKEGIASLRLFGILLPINPSSEQVDHALSTVWCHLGTRSIESLIDLPPMASPEVRMAMTLLADLGTPAIFGHRALLRVMLARMIDITLGHGTTEASVWAYLWFGATLVQRDIGRIQEGYRFGKLAWDLTARNPRHELRAKVNLIFGDVIRVYVQPVHTNRDYLTIAFQSAIEAGDLPWACYSRNHLITNMLSCGDPLDQVWDESERCLDFVRRAGDPNIIDILISQQQFILNLRGQTKTPFSFDTSTFDQDQFETKIQSSQMPLMVCWYYILKLQARFIMGDLDQAVQAAERAGALIDANGPDIQGMDYDFFAALAKAGRHRSALLAPNPGLLAEIEGHLALLRGWADHCPANFEARVHLVAAELARLTGQAWKAQHLYEQAIRSAQQNTLIHYEALASELAARFYQDRGFGLIADTYWRQSHNGFSRWGADGKCHLLETQFPRLRTRPPLLSLTTLAAPTEELDLASVIKASQSISAELVPARLQETLLRIAVEQAGARRGVLLLTEGEEWVIRAMAETESNRIQVTILHLPFDLTDAASPSQLPLSVLNYVRRTREAVVLASAETDGLTAADPYVTQHRPRSVLCLPILRKSKAMGALYLENTLLAGAFSQNTLAALELLAAQAAITLETATAYAERERIEAELRDQMEFTRRLLETIPAPVYYKDRNGFYGGCNTAFEHYVGRTRAHLVGKTVEAAWPPDLAEIYRNADSALFESPGTQIYETAFMHADGRRHDVVLHKASLARADGSVSGLVGVIWDITERTEAARALAQAKETAEAASAAKSRFLAAVGHDLRQPFQAIQLYHHLLMNRLPESQARDLCANLGEAIGAASSLLDTLLEISTFDGGAIHREISDFPLGPLLERLASTFTARAAAKGLAFRLVPTRVRVRSDPELLARALRGLLDNAISYTRQGRLLLGCRRCGTMVRIEVWDTGIGIPTEQLDAVFEDFFQLDNPERQRAKGFGLGLAIVRRTAALLNHRLWVRSWLDRGSMFAISVPNAD